MDGPFCYIVHISFDKDSFRIDLKKVAIFINVTKSFPM